MKGTLLLVGIFLSALLAGQVNTKMDSYLTSKLLQSSPKTIDATVMIPMLVQGNVNGIKQLVQAHGGIFKYSYKIRYYILCLII